jgi:hypothetical protein
MTVRLRRPVDRAHYHRRVGGEPHGSSVDGAAHRHLRLPCR